MTRTWAWLRAVLTDPVPTWLLIAATIIVGAGTTAVFYLTGWRV